MIVLPSCFIACFYTAGLVTGSVVKLLPSTVMSGRSMTFGTCIQTRTKPLRMLSNKHGKHGLGSPLKGGIRVSSMRCDQVEGLMLVLWDINPWVLTFPFAFSSKTKEYPSLRLLSLLLSKSCTYRTTSNFITCLSQCRDMVRIGVLPNPFSFGQRASSHRNGSFMATKNLVLKFGGWSPSADLPL